MKENFKDIINGDKPVLIDYYATWCNPCKVLAPIINEIALEVKEKARVLKIDIDKNPSVAQLYQIQSVPTLIIFKKGEIVWRHSGGLSKSALLEQLKYFL